MAKARPVNLNGANGRIANSGQPVSGYARDLPDGQRFAETA
jgi:hypothetical protein